MELWVQNNKKALPGQWAEKLSELLKVTGGPGKIKEPNTEIFVLSERYQAFEAWKSCLNQLCSFNQIICPINRLEAIDNLIKGGSGQGIQNMNIIYNFPETRGLV